MGQQRRTVRTHYRWQHNYPRVCGWLTTSAMQKNQAGIRFQSQDNRIQIDWQLNDLMSSKINDAVSFFPQNRNEMNYIFSFVFEFEFPPLQYLFIFCCCCRCTAAVHKRYLSPSRLVPLFSPSSPPGKISCGVIRLPLTMPFDDDDHAFCVNLEQYPLHRHLGYRIDKPKTLE